MKWSKGHNCKTKKRTSDNKMALNIDKSEKKNDIFTEMRDVILIRMNCSKNHLKIFSSETTETK